MTAPHRDRIVTGYLRQVETGLSGLPPRHRRELLDDLNEHIAESGADTDAALLTVLDQLGEPTEIAEEARRRFGVSGGGRVGPLEITVLLVIGLGSMIYVPLPVALLVGCLLLWFSRCWTPKAKRVGGYYPLAAAVAVQVLILALLWTDIWHHAYVVFLMNYGAWGSGPLLGLWSACYLTFRLGRRLHPVAWAVIATLFVAATVPVAFELVSPGPTSRASMTDVHPAGGKTKCGTVHASDDFTERGHVSMYANFCWDGTRVWKQTGRAAGPDCLAGYGALIKLTVRRCWIEASGSEMVMRVNYTFKVQTSPALGNSRSEEWSVGSDGSVLP